MIHSIGQVMLYVTDTTAAMDFWTKQVGFTLLKTETFPDAISYTIAPQKSSDSQLVLHDKTWVAKMNPEMNLGFPSLLMVSQHLEETYHVLLENGVTVHPITDIPFKHFNFSDPDGNYIAVREVPIP